MPLIFDLSAVWGRVQMTGRTRLEFLQRMATGDVLRLQPGAGVPTVLTTPIGRMVDYTPALALDDALILLTGGGNAGRVTQWLRRYVLYNDDVKVHDISARTQMLGLFGEGADAWLQALAPAAHDALHVAPLYASVQTDGQLLVKAPPLAGAGYYCIVTGDLSSLGQGVTAQLRPVSEYEALRIEYGYPAFPNEIGEDFIPLEAGLWNAVSFSKGCYIGQEIIARMESRNQMAKRLVQLELNVSAPADGATAGAIVAITSRAGNAALAYVRSAAANVGQILRLDDEAGFARVAAVIDLKSPLPTSTRSSTR